MVIFIIFLFSPCLSLDLPQGSLQSYYSSSELKTLIDSLTSSYPDLVKPNEKIKGFTIDMPQNSHLKKQRVLIIGGFSGGFPQNNYQVVYTAFNLLKNYKTDPISMKILSSLTIDFAPNINPKAYSLSEYHHLKTGEFYAFFKDQSNNTESCKTEQDLGINPEKNFYSNFEIISNLCEQDYAGSEPGTSEVIKDWIDSIGDYSLIINYQGAGEFYEFPLGVTESNPNKYSIFYKEVRKDIENSGGLIRLNNANLNTKNESGLLNTALEYFNVIAIKIALSSKIPQDLASQSLLASLHYNFLTDSILTHLTTLPIQFLSLNLRPQGFLSTPVIDLKLLMKNNGLNSIQYQIELLETYHMPSNNYKLIGLMIQSHVASGNSTTKHFNNLNIDERIEPGSYSTITFSFEQINKIAFENVEFGIGFVPLDYYVEYQSWSSIFYLNGGEVQEWGKRKLDYDNQESSSSSGSSVSVTIVIAGSASGGGACCICICICAYFMKKED